MSSGMGIHSRTLARYPKVQFQHLRPRAESIVEFYFSWVECYRMSVDRIRSKEISIGFFGEFQRFCKQFCDGRLHIHYLWRLRGCSREMRFVSAWLLRMYRYYVHPKRSCFFISQADADVITLWCGDEPAFWEFTLLDFSIYFLQSEAEHFWSIKLVNSSLMTTMIRNVG